MYYIVEVLIFSGLAAATLTKAEIIGKTVFKSADGSKTGLIKIAGVVCLLNALMNFSKLFQ